MTVDVSPYGMSSSLMVYRLRKLDRPISNTEREEYAALVLSLAQEVDNLQESTQQQDEILSGSGYEDQYNGRSAATEQDCAWPWVDRDPKYWAQIAFFEWAKQDGRIWVTQDILHEWFKAAFDRGACNLQIKQSGIKVNDLPVPNNRLEP